MIDLTRLETVHSCCCVAILSYWRPDSAMPIYEYICEDCQTHFEKIVLNKQQEIACPKCAGKKNAIQLSVFSSANSSTGGPSSSSSGGFSGSGGGCCGGGCGCH